MTALPIADNDQAARDRDRMMGALRALRTDVPLPWLPVPLLSHSRWWDSLTPKHRCDACGQRKPYAQFLAEPADAERYYEPQRRTCNACTRRMLAAGREARR